VRRAPRRKENGDGGGDESVPTEEGPTHSASELVGLLAANDDDDSVASVSASEDEPELEATERIYCGLASDSDSN